MLLIVATDLGLLRLGVKRGVVLSSLSDRLVHRFEVLAKLAFHTADPKILRCFCAHWIPPLNCVVAATDLQFIDVINHSLNPIVQLLDESLRLTGVVAARLDEECLVMAPHLAGFFVVSGN